MSITTVKLIQKLCEGYRYVCMYQFIPMFQIFLFPFYNVWLYIKWNILLAICNQTSDRNHCTYSILSLTVRWLFQLNIIIDLKWKTKTVGTIPKSNIKIIERGNIDTLNTQIKKTKSHAFSKAYVVRQFHTILQKWKIYRFSNNYSKISKTCYIYTYHLLVELEMSTCYLLAGLHISEA
jgi:hypothetical protein